MEKCNLNDLEFQKISRQIKSLARNVFGIGSPSSSLEGLFKTRLVELIHKWCDKKDGEYILNEEQDINNLANIILERSVRYSPGIELEWIRKQIDDVNIKRIDNNRENSNKLEESRDAERRKDMTAYFLVKAYQSAINIRNAVDKDFTKNLVDSFLVNRETGTIISTREDLNKNIRLYKNKLYRKIADYVLSQISSNNKSIPEDVMIALKSDMFTDTEYTGNFEKITNVVREYLLNNILGQSSDILPRLKESQLDAYNAWVVLSNFDSFVNLKLGEDIFIEYPGKHKFDKYEFSSKNKNIALNFALNDDIHLDREVSNVVKLLIGTTKVYKWMSSNPEPDTYLDFSDFSNVIGKLKAASFSTNIQRRKFILPKTEYGERVDETTEIVLDPKWGISGSTQSLLLGKSLGQIIDLAKLNPEKYFGAIFEVLCNREFAEKNKDLYKNDLNLRTEDKTALYSLYKGIFSLNEKDNSLYLLRKLNPKEHNYYSDITDIANSIYTINHTQYYKNDDGGFRVRYLIESNESRVRRQLESNINNNHNEDYDKEHIQVGTDSSIITIPDTTLRIGIVNQGLLTNIDKKLEKWEYLTEDEQNKVIDFLDEYLQLNLAKNKDLLNIIKNSDSNIKLGDLVRFASRVYAIQAIYDQNKENISNQETLNNVFGGDNMVSYLYSFNTASKICKSDVSTSRKLTRAYMELSGRLSASQINDTEGNGLPKEALNRFIDCYRTQIEVSKLNPDSAISRLSLIKHELVDSIICARELSQDGESKQTIGFNIKEGITSQLVYDYVHGLLTEKDGIDSNDALKDRKVAFTVSVFSDKPVIAKLLVNLNKTIETSYGVNKPVGELSIDELISVFGGEISHTYDKILENVNSDLYKLFKWANINLEEYIDLNRNTADYQFAFNTAVDSINLRKINDIVQKYNGTVEQNIPLFTSFDEFQNSSIKNRLLEWANSYKLDTKFLKPVDELNRIVNLYNQSNLDHIELIDQIHYVKDKSGRISYNKTLYANRGRFIVVEEEDIDRVNYWLDYQREEFLKTLIDSGFTLPLTESLESKKIKTLVNESWISKSNNLILAKINGVGISSISDLLQLYVDNNVDVESKDFEITNFKQLGEDVEIELNPLLDKINLLDYFITQQFMLSTVGTYAAHTVKGSTANIFEEESLRYNAQHKRNNDFTASTHAFALGKLQGIPDRYNISVVKHLTDVLQNVNGDVDETTPLDGGTIVNPFIVFLENYSLGPQKVGITKKQFVHYYNPKYATGGDIKTAGFGMTNDWIRNSFFMQNLMRKMTSNNWITPNGQAINILEDYNGDQINYGNVYFKQGTKYYKITDIQSLGNNQYIRTIQQVDIQGNAIGEAIQENPVVITNNYSLWQFFGGEKSLEINENGILDWSENSIKQVVHAMNNVGFKKEGVTNVETQDDVDQILKHSDIHYVCDEGSIKYGSANINPDSVIDDDSQLNYFSILMIDAGIQLDKEHTADNAEISLPTQVMNACSGMGYTVERANKVYKALSSIGIVKTSAFRKAVRNGDQTSREELVKLIVKELANATGENRGILEALCQDLIDTYRGNQKLDLKSERLPLGDISVFGKIASIAASNLTSQGIRLKVPGSLCVICPSYKIMKVYNGKKLEEFNDFKSEIAQAQQEVEPIYLHNEILGEHTNNLSRINIGRTYQIKRYVPELKDYVDEYREIKVAKDYIKLKKDIQNDPNIYSVVEWLEAGRELASYNAYFKSVDGRDFNIYDLDSVNTLFELRDNPNETLQRLQTNDLNYVGLTYDQAVKLARLRVQNDLKNLSTNYKGADVKDQVQVNGELVTIDKNSIEIQNYELIMPKVFASKFGLGKYDSVDAIKSDPYYFVKKLLVGYSHTADEANFDLVLKEYKEHVFLLQEKNLQYTQGLKEDTDLQVLEDEQGAYVSDLEGNPIKYLSSKNDKLFRDSNGNLIIVTKNIGYYLNNERFYSIEGTEKLKDDTELQEVLRHSKNAKVRNWRASLVRNGFKKVSQFDYKSIGVNDDFWKNPSLIEAERLDKAQFDKIYREGMRMYHSWLKSLEVVAARIPAQSQQSFMGMTVVAYENADVNNAYVSTAQLWLQGSDLDIDAVSLQTFDISRNGILEIWSPYAKIETAEEMKQSLELPFPSGNKTTLDSSDEFTEADAQTLKKFVLDGTIRITKYHNTKTDTDEIIVNIPNAATVQGIVDLLNTYEQIIKRPQNDEQRRKFLSILLQDNPNIITVQPTKVNQESETKTSVEYVPDDVNEILDQLKEIIDEHNTYLNEINPKKQEQVLNNFMIHNELEIIKDPVNLFQSQTPVDKATGPLKDIGNNSKKGNATKHKGPGNAGNKTEGIVNTQTGKQCVGVCAVGAKTFLAGTQFINTILNSKNHEDQQLLLFGPKGKGYTFAFTQVIDGKEVTVYKTFKSIANVKPLSFGETSEEFPFGDVIANNVADTIYNIRKKYGDHPTNEQMIELLGTISTDEDALILISALMSLATDNAKELQLSKLNAGMKSIGMYIYGLSIGMSFQDVSTIMLSKIATLCSELTESNSFINESKMFNLSKVFDYFEKGPNLSIFDNDIVNSFNSELRKIVGNYKAKLLDFSISSKEDIKTLSQKFKVLEELRGRLASSVEGDYKSQVNQLIDFAKEYCYKQALKQKEQFYYDDLKKLYYGGQEFRGLGQMLSLNQGIPTSIEDILTKIANIEQAINNRIDLINEEELRKNPDYVKIEHIDPIDIYEFAFNEQYRNAQIKNYERIWVKKGENNELFPIEIKHTINVLGVIGKVPHYLEYVQTLALLHKVLSLTTRYRSLYKLNNNQRIIDLNLYGDLSKGMNNFINDFLVNSFLIDKNITITLDAFKYINRKGYEETVVDGQQILLGTQEGNIRFKEWMDRIVFPNLMKGYVDNQDGELEINSQVENNAFINSLFKGTFDRTYDRNAIIAWATKVNTLPSDDYEQGEFDAIKNSFNDLGAYSYKGIPLSKLIYLYNQIVYSGKLGTQTFTKLFENKQNLDIIEQFHDFETELDTNGYTIDLDTDVDFYTLLEYIVPTGSIYTSVGEFVRARDPNDKRYKLYQKIKGQDYGYDNEDIGEDYEENGNRRKLRYGQTNNDINRSFVVVHTTSNGKKYQVAISEKYNKILSVKSGKNVYKLTEDQQKIKVITKSDGDSGFIDTQLLDDIIDNLEDPCFE